jgi:hypothetical protein
VIERPLPPNRDHRIAAYGGELDRALNVQSTTQDRTGESHLAAQGRETVACCLDEAAGPDGGQELHDERLVLLEDAWGFDERHVGGVKE